MGRAEGARVSGRLSASRIGYALVMETDHGPSIKNDEQYEALRNDAMSKAKAARIANSDGAAQRGGESPPDEEWTKHDLSDRAEELDIDGRSAMDKAELIEAVRSN